MVESRGQGKELVRLEIRNPATVAADEQIDISSGLSNQPIMQVDGGDLGTGQEPVRAISQIQPKPQVQDPVQVVQQAVLTKRITELDQIDFTSVNAPQEVRRIVENQYGLMSDTGARTAGPNGNRYILGRYYNCYADISIYLFYLRLKPTFIDQNLLREQLTAADVIDDPDSKKIDPEYLDDSTGKAMVSALSKLANAVANHSFVTRIDVANSPEYSDLPESSVYIY